MLQIHYQQSIVVPLLGLSGVSAVYLVSFLLASFPWTYWLSGRNGTSPGLLPILTVQLLAISTKLGDDLIVEQLNEDSSP